MITAKDALQKSLASSLYVENERAKAAIAIENAATCGCTKTSVSMPGSELVIRVVEILESHGYMVKRRYKGPLHVLDISWGQS